MIMPKGKIYVKGKRMSPAKVSSLIYKAVENIIMAGFKDADQLYNMAMNNANDNKAIANCILVNMLEDYLRTMSRECERMFFEPDRKTSTFNAKMHNTNISIINEVIGMIIDSNMPVPKDTSYLDDDYDEDDDYALTEKEILRLESEKDVLNILPVINSTYSEATSNEAAN